VHQGRQRGIELAHRMQVWRGLGHGLIMPRHETWSVDVSISMEVHHAHYNRPIKKTSGVFGWPSADRS
jgi:hypothetical protein